MPNPPLSCESLCGGWGYFEVGSHSVAQTCLELPVILLPQAFEYRDYRCMSLMASLVAVLGDRV